MKYFTLSLYLPTIISLVIQSVSEAKGIYSYCSIHDKFTSNEPYETNLKELMSYFSKEMHRYGWFSLGSKGHDLQKTHGLALCGINVSVIDCQRYVEDSSYEIRQSCPYSRFANVCYEDCMLKYSNNIFFGQIDNQITFYLTSSQNVSKASLFDPKKIKLLRSVFHKTSHAQKMYGIGVSRLNKPRNLYGSAQCTRDLSNFDCRKCLFGAISVLESYANGSRGARLYTESCSLRYELYNFFGQHELYNFIYKV